MIAIIGDIHGKIYYLEKLLDRIFKNYKIEKFIFLGDLIDRGEASKEVVRCVIELEKKFEVILLLGNHEDMMIDYIYKKGEYSENLWFENGGYETVKSFSKVLYNNVYFGRENISEELKIICEKELKFLQKAKLYHVEKFFNNKFFFVHGGIEDPEISIFEQSKFSYIWSREVDGFTEKIEDFTIVHGHTPVFFLNRGIKDKPLVNINEKNEIVSINIDTGCVYGGPLTAMIIDKSGDFEFVQWRKG